MSESSQQPRKSFTGIRRKRTTRASVKLLDRAAAVIISTGGIGTIVAVLTVGLFLFWVAAPLFESPEVEAPETVATSWTDRTLLHVNLGEYLTLGWAVSRDGTLITFRTDSGDVVTQEKLFGGKSPTAWSFGSDGKGFTAFGFEDGTVKLGKIIFKTEFLKDDRIPERLRSLKRDEIVPFEKGIVRAMPGKLFRYRRVEAQFADAIPLGREAASVVLLDQAITNAEKDERRLVALDAEGRLYVKNVRKIKDLLTDEETIKLSGSALEVKSRSKGPPRHLLMSKLGDVAYLAWQDGRLIRFNTLSVKAPRQVESLDLIPGSAELSALSFLTGRETLLAADTDGGLTAWFRVKAQGALSDEQAAEWPDDLVMLKAAHHLPSFNEPVTAMGVSGRSRTVAAGYRDGTVRIFQVTAEQLLAELPARFPQPVQTIAVAPADDGLLSFSRTGFARWNYDLKHHEASFGNLFQPVWYESYAEPKHVWQSTSGQDVSEAKLGLLPLVFGTLKATFYSFIFGAPLALLAAVYTSEFLHPKVKTKVKPTIEMMASLPSVVLGFLAALVFAPVAEKHLAGLLACVLAVPLALLVAAYLWQSLPRGFALRFAHWRALLACPVLCLGIWIGMFCGGWVENATFGGDTKAWANYTPQNAAIVAGKIEHFQQQESAGKLSESNAQLLALLQEDQGKYRGSLGGWFFIFLPLGAVGTALVVTRAVNPRIRSFLAGQERAVAALLDLAKFLSGLLAAAGAALLVAWIVSAIGADPRGGFFGLFSTYDTRNAMVVGFVMGFAIIPIIYTIADDALSSVPDYLRSASLAAGATSWQTAMRIVVPTAMSGLFSACMIGLGRAVGETMIVLMAAGNTPLMEMNIFNGFRTLAANIAVELPEAVKDSTHFRTLFLSALLLFAMTFVINTVAELVRLRFRRRALEL